MVIDIVGPDGYRYSRPDGRDKAGLNSYRYSRVKWL